MGDAAFDPPRAEVPAGTTVIWTNQDDEPRDIVCEGELWRSGRLKKGESYVRVFWEPGVYRYRCTREGAMQGVIVVTE